MTAPAPFDRSLLTDAGLYREWLAARYGQILTLGASPGLMGLAVSHARRLARLTGQTLEQVCTTARRDYRVLEGAV